VKLALRTALWAALLMAAAGAVEVVIRLMGRPPVIYDSRVDAVAFAWWGIGLGAAYGLAAGLLAGALLGRRLGVALAALVPLPTLLASWGGAVGAEGGIGILPGAWIMTAFVTLVVLMTAALMPARTRSARIPWWIAPLLVLVMLAVPAWLQARVMFFSARPPEDARNVLLITIDTLRADALGAFREGLPLPAGLERSATPALDALAAGSYGFLDAFSPVPKTPQAIASLMTGNYSYRHGFESLFSTLPWSNRTLAEALRGAGWTTAAVLTNGLIDRGSGIGQGFDIYRNRLGIRPGVKHLLLLDLLARLWPRAATTLLNRFDATRPFPELADTTTNRAIDMLRRVENRPFFLWVHYLDPHWTYDPPEPFRAQVDPSPGEPIAVYDDIDAGRVKIGDVIHHNAMPPEEVERLNALYAGEVRFLDDQLKRLLDAVAASPAASRTLIVVTADHGESLGEHDYWFSHGDRVYQPSLHVPLIIHLPGQEKGRRILEPVSLIDIAPTLLDMFGLGDHAGHDGRSLAGLLVPGGDAPAEDAEPHELYAESDLSYLPQNPLPTIPGEAGKLRAMRLGRYKLILVPHDHARARRLDPGLGARDAGKRTVLGFKERTTLGPSAPDVYELYDLREDPGETRDLSTVEPELTRLLADRLDAFLRNAIGDASSDRKKKDKDLLETLKSLGYIE